MALLVVTGLLALQPLKAAEPAGDEEAKGDDAKGTGFNLTRPFGTLGSRMKEEILQMSEFLDTTIPGTLKKYNVVLGLSPRTTDLRSREFIRFPLTIRYGLTDKWEIYTGMTAFSPNPFDTGTDHRWGPGEIRGGFRHDIGRLGNLFEQVTWGVEARTPWGEPPIEIIDHFTHVVPFLNTARAVPLPDTKLFMNFSYDESLDTPGRHPWPPLRTAHRNTFISSAGLLYKPGEFGASFEYSFRYFEDDSQGCHVGHQVRAGPIWDIPLWRTKSWGLPGKWQLELAGRITTEEGAELSHGVSLRVRWRTTLREVFSRNSYRHLPPPSTRFAGE